MNFTFYLFRVSLIPRSGTELFASNESDQRKDELIRSAIESRSLGVYRNTRYQILNPTRNSYGDLQFRLCRPDSADLAFRDPETGDLVDEQVPAFAWSHGIYSGEGTQVIAIARNTSFFAGKAQNIGLIIQSTLNSFLQNEAYEARVFPLTERTSFWEFVRVADRVTLLKFDLIPPNVFGGERRLRRNLRFLGQIINVKRFVQAFHSDRTEGLRVQEDAFASQVDYVSAGGGKWHAKGSRNGQPFEAHSETSIRTVSVESDSDDPRELGPAARDVADRARVAARSYFPASEPQTDSDTTRPSTLGLLDLMNESGPIEDTDPET